MSIIRLDGITKHYVAKGETCQALHDIQLTIKQGTIQGIIGFSGAGKSTLLRTINLLERPDSGKVWVNGVELTALTARALRQQRQSIGMIFQHFNLVQNATVEQNIGLPLEIAGIRAAERRQRIAEVLAMVGLEAKAKAYPAQLSGGQKQRVGIARALVTRPTILLCDEPTSALDPRTRDTILDFLQQLNRTMNLTLVLVTHEMAVVNAICHQVAVMDQGQIVEHFDFSAPARRPTSDIGRYLFGQPIREQRYG
ncbi:ABC transporter [Enterobacterales bacterium CwR94]|nr:ABC transporter [Enterobacterales bacterium CwR94]